MSLLNTGLSLAEIGLSYLTIKPKRGMMNTWNPSQTVVPDIVGMAVIEETHEDELEVTDHPIEYGVSISDHAFMRPAVLNMVYGWSNSPNDMSLLGALAGFASTQSKLAAEVIGVAQAGIGLNNLYNSLPYLSGQSASIIDIQYKLLRSLQASAALFDIYTGKRKYSNMIIKSIAVNTDFKTENLFICRIACREVLIAKTQTVNVPNSNVMTSPQDTASPTNAGTAAPTTATDYNASSPTIATA